MTKLWQKNWQLNKLVEAFETGDDLSLDQKLVWADVAGSIAHAKMLQKIGILSEKECSLVIKGLLSIQRLDAQGKFKLSMGDEDIHTKIENYLTENYGKVGKKIHTGRSRNDQILTALRLFTKQELLSVWEEILKLADTFLLFSITYEYVAMPGYTHMQKAMPSSVGMWASSFTESLLDDCEVLKTALQLVDQSPLGSAAGYGVPMSLDREYAAKLLGFAKVQNNSLYCQNSRGKIEGAVAASLILVMQTINKFASDVLVFTTSEFSYFAVAEELTTGSSIMPQKKNIDVAELVRSKLHVILGYYNEIIGISGNVPSGYNRDFQDTKKPFVEALEVSKQSIAIATLLVKNLMPNVQKLEAAMTPELFAAHNSLKQVSEGKAFRMHMDQLFGRLGRTKRHSKYFEKIYAYRRDGKILGLQQLQKQLAAEQKLCLNAIMQFSSAMARLGRLGSVNYMKTKTKYIKALSYEAKIGEVKKVLLLYSGGLDTSVMLKWIQDQYKAKVIALTLDIAQQKDYLPGQRIPLWLPKQSRFSRILSGRSPGHPLSRLFPVILFERGPEQTESVQVSLFEKGGARRLC